jgi:hypothetical protein
MREIINAYKIFYGRLKEKKALRRHRRRWAENRPVKADRKRYMT